MATQVLRIRQALDLRNHFFLFAFVWAEGIEKFQSLAQAGNLFFPLATRAAHLTKTIGYLHRFLPRMPVGGQQFFMLSISIGVQSVSLS